MTNPVTWDFIDWRGNPLPKPLHWDDHPEWFNTLGRAVKIRGPRYVPHNGERAWSWGPTEWVREIGEFTVLCFRWDRSNYSHNDQTEHGKESFAVWVNGVELDQVHESLDQALVDAVRFKYEGRRGSSGPRATEYFFKMIGAPEGD